MRTDELKTALAMVYSRKGATSLTRQQVVMGMSMELRWFLPGVAEQVVEAGLASGLLVNGGGELTPSFDTTDVDIPLDFRPSNNIIAITRGAPPPPPDLFMQIVGTIAEATGATAQDIVSRANAKVMAKGYTVEVAALLVGAGDGVDLSKFYGKVEERLRTR